MVNITYKCENVIFENQCELKEMKELKKLAEIFQNKEEK
jgi:hypothetical protein